MKNEDMELGVAINKMFLLMGVSPIVSTATLIELLRRMLETDIEGSYFDLDFRSEAYERLMLVASIYKPTAN